MNRIKTILAILLILFGISFFFAWNPFAPIFVFWPRPQLLLLALVVVLFVFGNKLELVYNFLTQIPAKWWVGFCSLFTTAFSAYLIYGPLEAIPHVPDDICYLWAARTFAMGKLAVESHDLKEFFHLLFFINDGKWYGLFQPGWPVLLLFGVFTGLEFLINPILAGVATALVYPIARRVFNDKIARLATFLFALAPMHIAIGSTLLSHTLAIVLTELIVLMILKMSEKDKLIYSLILGFSIGYLFTVRAFNAVIMLAVITPFMLNLLFTKKVSLVKVLAGAIISFMLLGLQLGYNYQLTGDAFYWPQDYYFDSTEPKKGCHSLGFGKKVGCPHVHPGEDFPDGFTFKDAVHVTHKRLGTFLLTLLGWNILLYFLAITFLKRKMNKWRYLLLFVFLGHVGGYFMWYFHGLWGRYYYESSFAMFILIAAGIHISHEKIVFLTEMKGTLLRRLGKAFIPAFVLAYFCFNFFMFYPETIRFFSDFFFMVDKRLSKMANEIPPKSIVFMPSFYSMGFIFLEPKLDHDVLFAHDLSKHNRQMMQYYPDWNFYRYTQKDNRLVKLKKYTDPSMIFLEGEQKIPITSSSGEFAYKNSFTSKNGMKCSGKAAITFYSEKIGSFFEFDQFIFKDGKYSVDIRTTNAPNMGKFTVTINGKKCDKEIDLYSTDKNIGTVNLNECQLFELKRGLSKIRIEVSGKHPDSSGYTVGFDWMKLNLKK